MRITYDAPDESAKAPSDLSLVRRADLRCGCRVLQHNGPLHPTPYGWRDEACGEVQRWNVRRAPLERVPRLGYGTGAAPLLLGGALPRRVRRRGPKAAAREAALSQRAALRAAPAHPCLEWLFSRYEVLVHCRALPYGISLLKKDVINENRKYESIYPYICR